jgi:hypothetical protein
MKLSAQDPPRPGAPRGGFVLSGILGLVSDSVVILGAVGTMAVASARTLRQQVRPGNALTAVCGLQEHLPSGPLLRLVR